MGKIEFSEIGGPEVLKREEAPTPSVGDSDARFAFMPSG
jgi:hypothetical protein